MANENPFKLAGIIQTLMDAEAPSLPEKTVTGDRMRKAVTVSGSRRRTATSRRAHSGAVSSDASLTARPAAHCSSKPGDRSRDTIGVASSRR